MHRLMRLRSTAAARACVKSGYRAAPLAGSAANEERVATEAAPCSLAQQPLELRLVAQPARSIESEAFGRRLPLQPEPAAAARAPTLQHHAPSAVRLRTRKPWRRARRVLDGW